MGYMEPTSLLMKGGGSVNIRTSRRDDGFKMHQLTKNVLQEQNNGLIMVHSDFQMTPEDQALKNESFLHFPQALSILAEHNSDCIGILTIEPEALSKTIHRGTLGIIVAKSHRAMGVGRGMMEAALKWNKRYHVFEKIELEVLETNKHAISLYENLGFMTEGVTTKAVKHGPGNYEQLIKMGLSV
ncbi:GNAT family N-acetyltransferase [Evansella sp. LMS18]|uniref:GNAT family N-acetyltransferase n=1 Tax=Evansella sp. LMS18 TaxID=2924033 RepID=UPI0020D18B3C|nr:GNAT family N-acetyltransferase [Evansella sp. LMS18]UTR11183.1 GNAT family N-acetyltransferase [Evansella sp. LMS18]